MGLVQQGQGQLGFGVEGHVLGHLGFLPAHRVRRPGFREVQPCGHGPGHRPLGVVAVNGDLTVADLAQGPRILAGDADGAVALLGETGVVEDQDAVAFTGQLQQQLHALPVEVVFIPGGSGEQALESLLGGPWHRLGDGVAILVGQFGEQAGEVAFEGVGTLGAGEVHAEGSEELGQFRQRLSRSLRHARCSLHTEL